MKKLLIVTVLGLSACSIFPKYKVTDEQVNEIIFLHNNIEQCLLPELKGVPSDSTVARRIYSRLTPIANEIVEKHKEQELLNVLGRDNAKIIAKDSASRNYLSKRLRELNNNSMVKVDPKECALLKFEVKKALKENAKKMKREKARQKAKEEFYKTPQGQLVLAQQRAAQQQEYATFFNMVHGMGAQIQQPRQLDYWQQLEIEKVKAKAQQKRKPTQAYTNCHNIGNQVYCDSTSY